MFPLWTISTLIEQHARTKNTTLLQKNIPRFFVVVVRTYSRERKKKIQPTDYYRNGHFNDNFHYFMNITQSFSFRCLGTSWLIIQMKEEKLWNWCELEKNNIICLWYFLSDFDFFNDLSDDLLLLVIHFSEGIDELLERILSKWSLLCFELSQIWKIFFF